MEKVSINEEYKECDGQRDDFSHFFQSVDLYDANSVQILDGELEGDTTQHHEGSHRDGSFSSMDAPQELGDCENCLVHREYLPDPHSSSSTDTWELDYCYAWDLGEYFLDAHSSSSTDTRELDYCYAWDLGEYLTDTHSSSSTDTWELDYCYAWDHCDQDLESDDKDLLESPPTSLSETEYLDLFRCCDWTCVEQHIGDERIVF
ncbi:Hypothetical predicted protein [Pelobates cultripes]|uniref:Uncharacterized protein n=1 Tax=Pelobates cultripes TaxID=61616 RepID=A0AAD1TMI7_PELCU|nr:Hypothetical predicted protein [Pelobates cultripes]